MGFIKLLANPSAHPKVGQFLAGGGGAALAVELTATAMLMVASAGTTARASRWMIFTVNLLFCLAPTAADCNRRHAWPMISVGIEFSQK
jgi:hypothetical protein